MASQNSVGHAFPYHSGPVRVSTSSCFLRLCRQSRVVVEVPTLLYFGSTLVRSVDDLIFEISLRDFMENIPPKPP